MIFVERYEKSKQKHEREKMEAELMFDLEEQSQSSPQKDLNTSRLEMKNL